MKPGNKIRPEIIRLATSGDEELASYVTGDLETDEQVESVYEALTDIDATCDREMEFRCGQVVTDIPPERSYYYVSKSVAHKMPDGSWVGWTYWFGGGKHGAPEAIDWIDEAYELSCVEEEKLVTVRTFTKL